MEEEDGGCVGDEVNLRSSEEGGDGGGSGEVCRMMRGWDRCAKEDVFRRIIRDGSHALCRIVQKKEATGPDTSTRPSLEEKKKT